MRALLHLDQEYEYLSPLCAGDHLTVTTRVGEIKERRGMQFVVLHTDIQCGAEKKIISNTTFVVRIKG